MEVSAEDPETASWQFLWANGTAKKIENSKTDQQIDGK